MFLPILAILTSSGGTGLIRKISIPLGMIVGKDELIKQIAENMKLINHLQDILDEMDARILSLEDIADTQAELIWELEKMKIRKSTSSELLRKKRNGLRWDRYE